MSITAPQNVCTHLADEACRLDYSQQMPISLSDPQAVEQTMNMSPMDLFDSIFWGKFAVCVVFSSVTDKNRSASRVGPAW